MTCLNQFRKYSLYFKSPELGLCLIFDEENADAGKECYKYLLLLQNRSNMNENEIQFGNKIMNQNIIHIA